MEDHMKTRSVAMIAAVASLGLVDGSAVAQGKCRQARGQFAGVFDPSTNATTGEITRGGWLDGTTLEVFHGAALPTPHPTTVSFTGDFTVATIHGRLKVGNVITFNVVTGNAAVLGHIDPAASTGRFAGATGVLYVAGRTLSFDPFIPAGEISGEVCFATE
jgi:hypothetical protein